MACADGGNPDPTSTQGKKAALAKRMEQKGLHYPKHLAGHVYGVVVHEMSLHPPHKPRSSAIDTIAHIDEAQFKALAGVPEITLDAKLRGQ